MPRESAQKIADMHVHSLYSFDSETTFMQIIKSAKQKNIYAVAVTDHCELAPQADAELLSQMYQANLTLLQIGKILP